MRLNTLRFGSGTRLVRRALVTAGVLAALGTTACGRARTAEVPCVALSAAPVAGVCPVPAPGVDGLTGPAGGGPSVQPEAPPPHQIARDGGLLWPGLVVTPDGQVRVGPGAAPALAAR